MEHLTAPAFLQRLWGLDHALDRSSKRRIRDLGVSGPQRVVLRLVAEAGEIGPGEIADRTIHHPATIQRLERRGHIRRPPSTEDRRRVVVVATASGCELGAHSVDTIEARVAAVLAEQDARDVEACMRVIEALTQALHPGR